MTTTEDFTAYSVGLVSASVCTNLSLKEANQRLNEEHPTGIDSEWSLSKDKTFASGEPNPCQCEQHPETNKHYLFNC
jgi:hypothetical protein